MPKSFVESAIARLSPLRRGNLERRLRERAETLESDAPYGETYEDGTDAVTPWWERYRRATANLGRFSAITASMEVR